MSRPTASLLLASASIKRWTEATRGRLPSGGLTLDEATSWAVSLWQRTGRGQVVPRLPLDWKLPDRLYALARLLARSEPEDHGPVLDLAGACFDAIEGLDWPTDLIGERTDLLARFAYIAWRESRRSGSWDLMFAWERRAVQCALKQEAVPEFLSVPVAAISDELAHRFLSDSAVLLAVLARLGELLKGSPIRALQDASAVYAWVSNHPGHRSQEEHAYFLAELEFALAAGSKHCGRYREARHWLDSVDRRSLSLPSHAPLQCRSAFLRLAVAHELRLYEEVLEKLPVVRKRFQDLGMGNYVARCTYLSALALKETGREEAAFERFQELYQSPAAQSEPWLSGLALIGMAEIEGRRQRFSIALDTLTEAWTFLRDSQVPLAVAHFHGIRGELERDQGLLAAAAESYRAALKAYAQVGMRSMAAYVRVVRAETLLAAGREEDSVREILATLPVIEELELVREGVAAIALLRESIRRQRADPEALKALRVQLQRMREGERS